MVGHSDGHSTDPQPPLEIDAAVASGVTLGDRYQVLQRLGGGGMGSVWRVHDTRTDEDVALKVLPPHAGSDALVRFRREVTLARRIAHLNVCRVFDLGEADGLHFLTMELIAGETLRARLQRGRLLWPEARQLIDDVLAGLAAVHGAGIVHRDIKPENILISADRRAVIVDFGLAWAPTARNATAPEVGTPQYMAPEQLSGGTIDPRTDVFAAGMVIHEILDGRPPFEGATAALVSSAILRDAPRPLEGTSIAVHARDAVSRVVARALGRDPTARPADAGELRKEWLAANAAAPTRRAARIRVLVGGVASAVALITATALITRLLDTGGAEPGDRPAPAAPLVTERSGDDAAADLEPMADAAVKPASFVIVPPWAAGKSHQIVQGYGTYQHRYVHSAMHVNNFHALDFDLALGEAVYPVADGTVIYAGPATGAWNGLGNIVFLEHVVQGVTYQSLYAHLASIANVNGRVSTTTVIGTAGRTGTSPKQVELHLAISRGASFTTSDVNGIGPYGGEAVIPEPFSSCTKNEGPCDQLVAGDVLLKNGAAAGQ